MLSKNSPFLQDIKRKTNFSSKFRLKLNSVFYEMIHSVTPVAFQNAEQPVGCGEAQWHLQVQTSDLSTYLQGLLVKIKCTNAYEHCWHSARKIPWTEEPGGLQSMGLLRVRHDWATSLSLFTFMHWRRKWQPTPVLLPGEAQGWGSLVGCRLWGHTESDTTEVT